MRNYALAFVLCMCGCGSFGEHGVGSGGTPNGTVTGGGGYGNVATSGAGDFAAFRDALMRGVVPSPDSLDETGFFAEHFTPLPPPECSDPVCLHGMLSVSPDAHGNAWTLAQVAMNSPIDPTTVTRAPLDLAVVLDRSGSMAEDQKMEFAHQGIDALIDQLGDGDTLTLISFSDDVRTDFGPAPVTDKTALHALVDGIMPENGTNLNDGLVAGYRAIANADETRLRRVILLTDGLPTVGVTDDKTIEASSAVFNEQHLGVTTIGLGADVNSLLLRTIAERGGGNYYFIEQPSAVTEVFTDELAFFVAPLAYDVEISLTPASGESVATLFGPSTWTATATGARLHVPALYLASRQSDQPDPTGGRRGGGSAIIAQLAPSITQTATAATIALSFRKPGDTTTLTQSLDVAYDPAQAGPLGYFSIPTMQKNTWVLDFFVAFRDATATAQSDRAGARTQLVAFQQFITGALAGNSDADLADDLALLQRYIDILN